MDRSSTMGEVTEEYTMVGLDVVKHMPYKNAEQTVLQFCLLVRKSLEEASV